MRSDIPHFIGCDLAVFGSDEDPPAFAEAVYRPHETDPAETLARLDAMPYPEEAETAHAARLLLRALALLIFFALGLAVGRLA